MIQKVLCEEFFFLLFLFFYQKHLIFYGCAPIKKLLENVEFYFTIFVVQLNSFLFYGMNGDKCWLK